MGLRKRCSITNMKEKQRDKDLHQFHWMGWSENFGRIESSRYDKNLSIYLGFIFLCISAFNKMITMIFLLLTSSPFLVSSSSLHRANVGKCTDNQVGWSIDDIQSSTYSGQAHSPWRYPLRRNRGLGFWPPPPEGGRSSHRGLLLLEPMRFHRLNWRQHVHNWCGFALWREVWWEVEGCVHPSQHSTSAMVTTVSERLILLLVCLRYMTVGNHDHSLNREWHQVEYSALEPRWKLPCLTHSFNVSTTVS